MTEEEAETELAKVLAKHGKSQCPSCARVIDRGDVAWNEGSTDAGTPFSFVTIQCLRCDTQIAYFSSWNSGGGGDFITLVEHILPDWE